MKGIRIRGKRFVFRICTKSRCYALSVAKVRTKKCLILLKMDMYEITKRVGIYAKKKE